VDTHCIENFFTLHGFWATCACPKKQSLPWNFSLYWIYFLHSGFLSNLFLPWKTECALKSFTVLNMLFTFRIFEQLALALKNSVTWNFSLYWNISYHSGFLSNLRLPWKTECNLEFFTLLNILFIIQDFWATCVCPEKSRVSPEIFHCIEYPFTFRSFEQLALALKKQS